jgi:hypothetical protein
MSETFRTNFMFNREKQNNSSLQRGESLDNIPEANDGELP